MASAQEPCLVRFYRVKPNGNKTLILQDRVESLAAAGGAPDGAATSMQTTEKWPVIDSNVILVNDDILEVTVELDASDGIDVSDCIWRIPLVTSAGTKAIGRGQFSNPTPADNTPPASQEIVLGGYRIVEGQARVSGRVWFDVQDDTA